MVFWWDQEISRLDTFRLNIREYSGFFEKLHIEYEPDISGHDSEFTEYELNAAHNKITNNQTVSDTNWTVPKTNPTRKFTYPAHFEPARSFLDISHHYAGDLYLVWVQCYALHVSQLLKTILTYAYTNQVVPDTNQMIPDANQMFQALMDIAGHKPECSGH